MLLSYQLAIDVLVLLAGSPNQISQLPTFDKSGEGPALHRLGHSRTRINYILPLTFSLQSINSCIYLSQSDDGQTNRQRDRQNFLSKTRPLLWKGSSKKVIQYNNAQIEWFVQNLCDVFVVCHFSLKIFHFETMILSFVFLLSPRF